MLACRRAERRHARSPHHPAAASACLEGHFACVPRPTSASLRCRSQRRARPSSWQRWTGARLRAAGHQHACAGRLRRLAAVRWQRLRCQRRMPAACGPCALLAPPPAQRACPLRQPGRRRVCSRRGRERSRRLEQLGRTRGWCRQRAGCPPRSAAGTPPKRGARAGARQPPPWLFAAPPGDRAWLRAGFAP